MNTAQRLAPELHHRYRARVRIRRGPDWKIKPGLEALEGRELSVVAAWRIGPDESEQYATETAMMSRELEPFGLIWIASGDLELLDEIPQELA